jgi:CheY-like chemotaxis protein
MASSLSKSNNEFLFNDQGRSLLVVEDDPDIRAALKELLEGEGYEVSVAENGAEALELLPKISKPSLILLDLMMPIMNGNDFAKELANHELYSTIPVMVLTAFKGSADIDRSKEVIRKPIDADVLLDLVKRHFFRGLYSETENSDY